MKEFGPVDYTKDEVPENYKCSKCNAHGVKLWRECNVFFDHNDMSCCRCASAEEGVNVESDSDGKHVDRFGLFTDQIGSLVPAVPTEDGDSCWGYTSVPRSGVLWWKSIPTYARSESKKMNIEPVTKCWAYVRKSGQTKSLELIFSRVELEEHSTLPVVVLREESHKELIDRIEFLEKRVEELTESSRELEARQRAVENICRSLEELNPNLCYWRNV